MDNELPQTLPSFDPTCYSDKEKSVPCVSKPNFVDESSNIFNLPSQPPIYSCEFCGSNAQYGYNCTPQAPFNNPEQGYSQDLNFSQNIHNFQQKYLCPHENFQCQPVNYCEPNPSYDSYYSGFDQFGDFQPQQYHCCENCGGPHESFQCQPTNEEYYHEQNSCYNSNSFGSDHCQPPQYTVNHPIFDAHNDFLNSQNDLSIAQNTIMEQMTQLTSMCELVCQIFQKKQEEKRIEEEQAASARYWKIPACCDDDDDYDFAITLVLSTEEPVTSLSMGDEHLDTILATESDEVIKSSVEDLIQIPSDSEGIYDTMCDVHLVNNPTPLEAKDHFEIVINSNDDISSNDDDSLQGEHRRLVVAVPLLIFDISLSDYEVFYFNNDHIKEISSGNTTTHSDISLSEYDSFVFDLSNDQCPPTNRSDFANEEFADDSLTSYLHRSITVSTFGICPIRKFDFEGWSISITFWFSVGLQTPDDLSQSRLVFIEKIGWSISITFWFSVGLQTPDDLSF
nr:hypothetical protein [Tanacetum cinerariifolium]